MIVVWEAVAFCWIYSEEMSHISVQKPRHWLQNWCSVEITFHSLTIYAENVWIAEKCNLCVLQFAVVNVDTQYFYSWTFVVHMVLSWYDTCDLMLSVAHLCGFCSTHPKMFTPFNGFTFIWTDVCNTGTYQNNLSMF
jgi:hypothetical protein